MIKFRQYTPCLHTQRKLFLILNCKTIIFFKIDTKQHIKVGVKIDELDMTAAESKATHDEIKKYVLEKHGLKVPDLYISQVKRKCGIDV